MIEEYFTSIVEKSRSEFSDRFWSKVDKSGTCWLWTASKNQNGRGLFRVGCVTVSAPRVAYELIKGAIPPSLFVCHTCDNPTCVNPDHLWVGSHSENMADRTRKGRTSRWRSKNSHCPHGHEFNEENTRFEKRSGARSCRTCCRERERARLQKKRIDKSS